MNESTLIGLERLRELFPWPDRMPSVPEDLDLQGWLTVPTAEMIAKALCPDMLVLELGAWQGKSTTFISDMLSPMGYLISADTWEGKVEIPTPPVQNMRALWQANCWQYRDQLTGVPLSTQKAMATLAALDITPDLVYLDASHQYADVLADLRAIHDLFPAAQIVGDDYYWRDPATKTFPVAEAVKVYVGGSTRKLDLEVNEYAFRIVSEKCPCRKEKTP